MLVAVLCLVATLLAIVASVLLGLQGLTLER
jgi:hypothetical protein